MTRTESTTNPQYVNVAFYLREKSGRARSTEAWTTLERRMVTRDLTGGSVSMNDVWLFTTTPGGSRNLYRVSRALLRQSIVIPGRPFPHIRFENV